MKKLRINKKSVNLLKIIDKSKVNDYIYLPAKEIKYWLWPNEYYPEGFYYEGSYHSICGYMTMDTVSKSKFYEVIDKELYHKPYISAYVNDFLVYEKHFDSINDAKIYLDKNYPDVNYELELIE